MGYMEMDGVVYGDRPHRARPVMPAGSSKAMAEALVDVDRSARKLMFGPHGLVKTRARAFKRWPWQLDILTPFGDLSSRSPSFMIAALGAEQERIDRYTGRFGDVRPINLRGARLYARYMRRFRARLEDAALDRDAEQAVRA